MAASGNDTTLDVSGFLDARRMSRFHYTLLVVSCFVTFFDGLDFSLISYTLPYLREQLSLDATMTGYVTAAAFLGQMIGSLFGSYVADLYGRRPVVIWCTMLGAVFTFITGLAGSAEMIIFLRFLGGLAIGGLLAPAWSINIESMPAGKKATAVTIIMLGFSAGGAAAGQVTNLLAPEHGWQAVFFACGAATGALALILLFTMPESARWLVTKQKPAATITKALARFDPRIRNAGYSQFVLSDERKTTSSESPLAKSAELFKGTLGIITPLIWATYFCSSFAIYLRSSYGVVFLEALGVGRAEATNIGSIGGLIGAVGGVLVLMFTERRGPAWIAAVPLLGIPAMLAIGWGLDGGPWFIPIIMLGTIMVGIGHAAVISMTSIYYPSAVRATGGGWASFVAKFAAVAAPIVGSAWFIADKPAVQAGYVFTAACLAGVVLGVLALAVFARRLATEHGAASLIEEETEVAAGA
ncbi:MAG: 4-hydroxybenzoate transporter PcaK [Pseudomonadota bacterium]|jgi:AAHS family 4-hydroxybenzoate transporter-like MFS transporter